MALEVLVNMKQFIIACMCFIVAALGAIFGLTVLFIKVLVPPSGFDAVVERTLGDYGALIVTLTSYVLGVGLVFIATRKFVVARFVKKNA